MRTLGRYVLYDEIAAGGMATIHLGRLRGAIGFTRTVAIKYLHPQFAKDPEFVSMFLDEARLAARVRHPNVVPTLDVVASQNEIFLVMEYVAGESLWRLLKLTRDKQEHIPIRILGAIMSGVLHGLHAAYEAKTEQGEPLRIVHRDISPQNILVGSDGAARVLDFGVAKATSRSHSTRAGKLKGKLAYMAPEQLTGVTSHQTDLYAAAIVLWEALTNKRLFSGENEGETIANVMRAYVERPSNIVPGLPEGLDDILFKGLARDPEERYATGREFAFAIEKCMGTASAAEVGEWVETHARDALAVRAQQIANIERKSWDSISNEVTMSEVHDAPQSESAPNSIISINTDTMVTSPWKRRATILFATLATVLLGFLLFGFALVPKRKVAHVIDRSERDPEPTASISQVIDQNVPPPPMATAAGVSGAGLSANTTASAEITATIPTISGVRRVQHPTVPRDHDTQPMNVKETNASPQVTPVTPTANCDPPYTLDSNGRKMWKRECM